MPSKTEQDVVAIQFDCLPLLFQAIPDFGQPRAVETAEGDWLTPTTAVLGEVAERLAGAVLALPKERDRDWPDNLT